MLHAARVCAGGAGPPQPAALSQVPAGAAGEHEVGLALAPLAVSLFTFAGHTEVISVMRSMGAEVRWGRGAALLPTCYRLPTTAYCLLLTHCLLLTAYYYLLLPRRRATVPSRA